MVSYHKTIKFIKFKHYNKSNVFIHFMSILGWYYYIYDYKNSLTMKKLIFTFSDNNFWFL